MMSPCLVSHDHDDSATQCQGRSSTCCLTPRTPTTTLAECQNSPLQRGSSTAHEVRDYLPGDGTPLPRGYKLILFRTSNAS
jgi:hypothetical protein